MEIAQGVYLQLIKDLKLLMIKFIVLLGETILKFINLNFVTVLHLEIENIKVK